MRTPHTLSAAALALFLISSGTVLGQDPQEATLPTIPQDSAESACKALIASLAQGNGGAFWAMMPKTYQKDIQSAVHGLAQKVPAELWNDTFGFLAVVRDVLKSKKQLILGHPMVQELDVLTSTEELAASLDTAAAFLDALVESDLATAEKAREIDVERFFVFAGSKILAGIADANGMWGQLDEVQVDVVGEATDSETTLRITVEDAVYEETWSKVDGKWIPTLMASAWDASMATVNEQLSQMMDEMNPQTTMQMSMMLGMVRGIFTQVANAKDQDAFNEAVAAIVQMAQMFR